MILELHIIQNFSPSCLNRDDLNAPKDCEFGGVRRARISSQCLKRATRWNDDFQGGLSNGIGTRTKFLRSELVKYLASRGKTEDEASRVVEPVVSLIGSGVDDETGRTSIALYLGHDEIRRIAEAIEQRYDDLLASVSDDGDEPGDDKPKTRKKAKKGSGSSGAQAIAQEIYKSFKPGTTAADIALFGRMIAEGTNFNVDAACQVAHAISTHEVPSEFDFFTAVDDLQPKGDPGAGMMGSQQFNSATFYRYANVHLNQLAENLSSDADLARAAATAFARAFVTAIPAAKQNSHAALNPPDAVFVVVRAKGQAISLANAFANPIRKGARQKDAGLLISSSKALAAYWERILKTYIGNGITEAAYYTVPEELDQLSFAKANRVDGLDDLIAKVSAALATWKPEETK